MSIHLKTPSVNNPANKWVSAYLKKSENVNPTPSLDSLAHKTLAHPLVKQKKMSTLAQKNKRVMLKKNIISQPYSKNDYQDKETLLSLLHNAIQKEQHYPISALEMERSGSVTVAFFLFVDGHVENVHVTKSSGDQSLDQAAMDAVNQAVPFQEVKKYLAKSTLYSVDVVFELD